MFIQNTKANSTLTLSDNGSLYLNGYSVPHNWRQSFTPFLYSATGTFTHRGQWGQAVYLGDLVFVQGRVIATRGGHTGDVCIGGLPVANISNYPPVTFGFFGGVNTGLGTSGYDLRGYVQVNASHVIINYSNKDSGGWAPLNHNQCTPGEFDVTFSAVYRWR